MNAFAASGCLAFAVTARRHDGGELQFGGQHADHLDLRIRHQFGDELQSDFGFAARHQHADAAVRSAGGKLGLRGDFVCDAELLEHVDQVHGGDAAAGWRGVADRLGGEQRALERVG